MNRRARKALKEILSSDEFKPVEPNIPWWIRLIEKFFDLIPSGIRNHRWIGTLVEWVLIALTALAVILFLFYVAKRFRKLPSFDHEIAINSSYRMDPQDMRKQAYEYYDTGDYRQAIRYLYLSLLLYMNKANFIVYESGKTDGEYIREIKENTIEIYESFASLAKFFQRKWYGAEESTKGDFKKCEEVFATLAGSVPGIV